MLLLKDYLKGCVLFYDLRERVNLLRNNLTLLSMDNSDMQMQRNGSHFNIYLTLYFEELIEYIIAPNKMLYLINKVI